jgi:hypothetical protein
MHQSCKSTLQHAVVTRGLPRLSKESGMRPLLQKNDSYHRVLYSNCGSNSFRKIKLAALGTPFTQSSKKIGQAYFVRPGYFTTGTAPKRNPKQQNQLQRTPIANYLLFGFLAAGPGRTPAGPPNICKHLPGVRWEVLRGPTANKPTIQLRFWCFCFLGFLVGCVCCVFGLGGWGFSEAITKGRRFVIYS